MLTPVRYIQRRFEDGDVNSSVFSLIQVTLGAGLLTFPYAIMQNGIVIGSVLIALGGLVSWYTGMLLISASAHTNKITYEEIAEVLYGKKFAIVTAIMNLLALLGFNMSYVVYLQTAMPNLLALFMDPANIPTFLKDDTTGHRVWGAIFTVRF